MINLTEDIYEDEVINSDVPVLIDFWASWCGPCQMLSPVVEEIDKEFDDVKVCKVNVDEQPNLAAKFSVMSIPTLVLMNGGKVVDTSIGVLPKNEILQMIGK